MVFFSLIWHRIHCVARHMNAVVEPDRSCMVSVTSSPLHIAAAAAAAGVDSWSTQSTQSFLLHTVLPLF